LFAEATVLASHEWAVT